MFMIKAACMPPLRMTLLALVLLGGWCLPGKAAAMNQVCWIETTGGLNEQGEVIAHGEEHCFDLDSLGTGNDGGGNNPTGGGGGPTSSGTTDTNVANEVQKQEKDPCKEETTSQPVIIATGTKIKPEQDFSTHQGDLSVGLLRLYDKNLSRAGIFGSRWSSNLEYSLTFQYGETVKCVGRLSGATTCFTGGKLLTAIYAYRASGYAVAFSKDASGQWKDAKGNILVQEGTNWKLIEPNGSVDLYDSQGRPLSIKDERGIGFTYTYVNNQVSRITHTTGKFLTLTWSAGGKVSAIGDSAGKTYSYAYNGSGYLASVTYPDGLGVRGYLYEDTAQPGGLTGITVNGVRYSRYEYYADGRVKSSGLGPTGIIDRSSFVYGADYVNVTNALGQVTRYEIGDINGSKYIIGVERPLSSICPAGGKYTAYDANGNVDYTLDALGVKTDYTYDANDRLIQKVVGIGPNGETDQQQITKFVWDAAYSDRLLTVEVYGATLGQPLSKTVYDYYPTGHVAARLLKSVTRINLSSIGTANQAIVTAYGYSIQSNGLIQAMVVDGPVAGTADQITYQYDTAGNLLTVSNTLGHTVTYGSYTTLGQPGRMTGANGDIEDYTYDAMGRITNRRTQLNGELQDYAYAYDAHGNLTRAEHPDGQVITYIYYGNNPEWPINVEMFMAAGIAPTAKQVVSYARNALGQVTSVTKYRGLLLFSQPPICNPICQPTEPGDDEEQEWTYTAVSQGFIDYDAGGLVQARRGNTGQNVRYTYNANGDLLTMTDSLGKATTLGYDRRRRVIQSTDALNGATRYAYDAVGHLVRVTDPRNKVTTYSYDGLGQLWSQTSPDTGTTTFENNSSGLRSKLTRAAGEQQTFAYDGLGRLTTIQAASLSQGFTYDTCAGGKSRLCKVTDSTGSVSFAYAPQGMLLSQKQLVGTTVHDQIFVHDGMGQVTGISYTGGVSVGYAYRYGQVSAMTATVNGVSSNVITNPSYEPFTGIKSWTYGNGLRHVAGFDMDGRVNSIQTLNGTIALQSLAYAFNANNEITQRTNALDSGLTQSYTYDDLGRLTKATRGGSTSYDTFAYDANGNRTGTGGLNGGAAVPTKTYQIDANSNRLLSVVSTAYAYDANGNLTSNGVVSFDYNEFNRLSSSTKAGVTTYYQVNALGQRVYKGVSATTATHFAYAPNGALAMEYNANGGARTHYLWLEGKLVGLVRGGQLYFAHNDHLGRPEIATNSAKSVVWRASNMAFDRTVTLSSIGSLNLGFPGQYYDSESGTWNNGFRDYDASTGRYLQSDPIGLAGGLNTYAYVGGNPISHVDPLGLEDPNLSLYGSGVISKMPDRRGPDYFHVSVGIYVATGGVTLTRNGTLFVGYGVAHGTPSSLVSGKLGGSAAAGYMQGCAKTGEEVDNFVAGATTGGSAYYVVGGGYGTNAAGSAVEFGAGTPGAALQPFEYMIPVLSTGLKW